MLVCSHLVAFSSYVFFPLEKPLFCILNSFSTESRQIPLLSRFLGLTQTASRQIGRSIEPKSCALCLLDTSLTDSQSIEVGFFLIDSRHLLDRLRYPCMHFIFLCFAFFSLVIHNILFHYIHAFIQIPCAPLVIFGHLYVSWVKFYSFLYPSSIMTKRGRKCGFYFIYLFIFMILHVRGRNTYLCKGELCFILLGGVFTSLLFQVLLLASCTPVL